MRWIRRFSQRLERGRRGSSSWSAKAGILLLVTMAAAVLLFDELSWPAMVDPSPTAADAAEPEMDLPEPDPLLFTFSPGSAEFRRPIGTWSESDLARTNGMALDRYFTLRKRLADLPVRWVWAVGGEGDLSDARVRQVLAALGGMAMARGLPPTFPEPRRSVVDDARADELVDRVELRLIAEPLRSPNCKQPVEVVDPSLPRAAEGGPVRLVLTSGVVEVGDRAVWRVLSGQSKGGLSDFSTPWNGDLLAVEAKSEACSVILRPLSG